ncbi:MAG: hypothetical protein CMB80_01225 [Flammeovirgaceae bacterium]|nr:hypothetical protein [Flammeovirgaceae bacterium]
MKNIGPLFTIVVPILNQHQTTADIMDSWFTLCKNRLSVIFIDNNSDELLSDQPFIKEWSKFHDIRVIRNDKNVGVYPTFQQGFELVHGSKFIFYSHNDVEMIELGWDEKMGRILRSLHDESRLPGVCGMFGADGIGTPDIYKAPYDFRQMMRWNCHTVESMVGAGGESVIQDFTPCMVLDGFSLITSIDMINSVGGFHHEDYPVHHMYDNDICLASHYAGFRNYIIDIDCKHHGGVTSTRETWAEEMGTTDLAVHRKAHTVFYEKWRGKLPISVA